MTGWTHNNKGKKREANGDLGGTMRLGCYTCKLLPNSHAQSIYQAEEIKERDRLPSLCNKYQL